MQANTGIEWDTTYDVVVVGFGGAGATAARFAADNGAKVLLVDSAPEGQEGGNTRYCAQLIGSGNDYDQLYSYYSKLTAPMDLDEEMKETFVSGMFHMKEYIKDYLEVEPYSFDQSPKYNEILKDAIHEYPEFPGVETYDFLTVHDGMFDAALWKLLKEKVTDRSDKIDVWYESPALHLIQDEQHKTVLGVQIKRKGVELNVQAANGVILTLGGFENDQQKIQDYLGASSLAPLGSLYNQGAGIDMAIEAGAQLWHMRNYESLGMMHGLAVRVEPGSRAAMDMGTDEFHIGSIFVAGDDGSRYFNESEGNRHGHIYNHGTWAVPQNQDHPHLIFDQQQYDKIVSGPAAKFLKPLLEKAVSADTIADLAEKIGAVPEILANEVADFALFAEQGRDYRYNRDPQTMKALGAGPYYALALEQTVLNTQGGPLRNSKAEVLDINNEPIPHLYSAGELGGICANQYQGGGNIAECLIFGKIAGENAARGDVDTMTSASITEEHKSPASSAKSAALQSDVHQEAAAAYSTESNQFIGQSAGGIGDEMVVRITVDSELALEKIEVLQQSESEHGFSAIEQLPEKMVAANSYDVDVVSGASSTSRALKAAVKDALEKAQTQEAAK
ncbi:fumarate reductase flavoprotein subunit [Ligilactobacillus salitolerans]|uniref:Urocanate reductase n=1 Tax=Ligilactobacillus salitolerans TaxID=1808352 RepID=A0A401IRX0_9LACO|nr:FAD-binding protein [Ligilactobacillus salitolerans]GBG94278.1 fumarate reductase flavoprotein subunit [Ligilactobacillus salitolerans]